MRARLAALAVGVTAVLAALPGTAAATPAPMLSVRAAALYAPQTGQLLYGVNEHKRVAIASATKLMTALITLDHVHSLDTVFTQNDYYASAADSQIGLVPGERMTVHDLLLALMLPSADDAAEDLAYNVGHGSVARFVAMMNAEARVLGLTDTHYSTPSGLDTPGNYSSAADLTRLAQYDMQHSRFFAHIVGLRSAVLHSGRMVRNVVNRNDLVGRFPWIDGVKTGHTNDAGYVLVASGHRGGMTLISAVEGTVSAQARDDNTLALLNYGFSSFSTQHPITDGEVLARPTVQDQPGMRVPVRAGMGVTQIVARGERLAVTVRVARQLAGPLPAQSVVGTAVVMEGGRVLTRVPLVLGRRLDAVSSLTLAGRFITQPLMLLVIVAIAGVGGFLWRDARRRRRPRRSGAELEAA